MSDPNCTTCGGSGTITREGMMGEEKHPCPACDGTGDETNKVAGGEPRDEHPAAPAGLRKELRERGHE